MATYNVLIMGASYGSLLATKLLFGGHRITMVCLPAEVEAFNADGARVRLPVRGRLPSRIRFDLTTLFSLHHLLFDRGTHDKSSHQDHKRRY